MSVFSNLGNTGESAELPDGATRPCLHEFFRGISARHPDRTAVSAPDGTLTYRQLDAASDRLAAELVAAGAKPGTVVGLCVRRETGLLVGILGILKSGAAYLPVDPEYPAERIRWTISDADCPLAVISPGIDGVLEGLPVRTLSTAAEVSGITDVPRVSRDTDIAYVIHTSGSTGEPKGVAVEHRAVVRLFEVTRPWFGFAEETREVWSLFHSAAFDFSVWEIWGALLHGGRVVVVPSQAARSPAAFHGLLRAEGVTVLSQTPGALRRLAAADAEAGPLTALHTVVLGGERLEPASLRHWFERYGDQRPRVVNMYGITEVTVHASYRPMRRADLERTGPSPIGVPLPGLTFHVRDADGHPVPDGTPGELYIEGPGVARGYLGRPELTAERFSAGAGSGHSTYRTGDRVVRLADGEYGYLGRADDQFTLRGYRVEPGEVEAVLARHPAVDQAVVRPYDYGEDDVRLVAYVVGGGVGGGGGPGEEELEAELAELAAAALPPHMRPSRYVRLDAVPLTVNGKVDRRALPDPGTGRRETYDAGPGPATPTEERIAGIWRAVLDLERVAVDADFFDLGGTSLSLLRMFDRVNAAFGTDLDITVLIDEASVAALAAHVDTARMNRGDA